MGVCLNLQQDNSHPYIKAVTKFGDFLTLRIMNPIYLIPLVWRLLGYERETKQVVRTLQSLTTEVSKMEN